MATTPRESPPEVPLPDASAKTQALLRDLWRRNRPVIEARLETLDRAAATERLDPELHAEALDVAHKLSGALGMFGFDRGTEIAREVEQLLGVAEPDLVKLGALAQELRVMLLSAS